MEETMCEIGGFSLVRSLSSGGVGYNYYVHEIRGEITHMEPVFMPFKAINYTKDTIIGFETEYTEKDHRDKLKRFIDNQEN